LIRYQSLKIEYETTISDLERQSKTTEKTFDELKKANSRIAFLESELEDLKLKIYTLGEKYVDAEKKYRLVEQMYYNEKSKVYKMKKQQANVYIWRWTAIFAIICMFIVAGNNS
jgi:hypothetical protein